MQRSKAGCGVSGVSLPRGAPALAFRARQRHLQQPCALVCARPACSYPGSGADEGSPPAASASASIAKRIATNNIAKMCSRLNVRADAAWHFRFKILTSTFATDQADGSADRIAQRNFAELERGLLRCSSGDGRIACGDMLEYVPD